MNDAPYEIVTPGLIEHYRATREHVERVQHFMLAFAVNLLERAIKHDASKYDPIEANEFARVLPKLRGTTYGSDEYRATLREIRPAIDHHNTVNTHHPEHYDRGISGMDLLDIVEMFCDWRAATERHANGDIRQSIAKNQERFQIAWQLVDILINTVPFMERVA